MIDVHLLGLRPYQAVFSAMKEFTAKRDANTTDELWVLEHPAVFTQGQAGKEEHVLQTSSIPIVQSDRGGQITYHGPGQLVSYILMDLKRKNLGIRTLVTQLEQTIIALLDFYGIHGQTICGAPGVYVDSKKIASIGLRVKNHCTYHGIALNVSMDLQPFNYINPCGHAALQMTQLQEFIPDIAMDVVVQIWVKLFLTRFDC